MRYAIFETDSVPVLLRADEISDDDIQALAVNCKMTATFYIFPTFEAWQKCKRTLTYVRIIDTDKAADRIVFKGRVLRVTDNMDNSGRMWQEITCFSAADYLEDTAHVGAISGKNLSVYMADELSEHNSAVDLPRRLTYIITGSASVNSEGMDITGTRYNALSEILTGGKYLSKLVSPSGAVPYYTMEWRERYANDVAYIDIAEKFGEEKETAIVIGENLKDIKVERNTDGGIYTSVLAVGGVNSDGSRMTHSAANSAMQTLYGTGRVLIVENADIRCTAPMWEWSYAGTNTRSNAQLAMLDALRVYADQEAAKLSDPPMKITINAVDHARLGLAGYDGFEVGNSHPVVCPPLGLFGEPMRITAIKRKLASGQVASITIEKGQKAGVKSSGTLSYFMARLNEENSKGTEEVRQTEIAQTKAEEQTDNYVVKEISQEDYDDLPSTSPLKTRGFCIIRDSQTGESKLMVNDTHISSGGGGGGGTIEYAAILSEERMSEWAPDHELVPLWFRGSATVYYGQAPARFVVQNNRVLWGGTAVVEDDIAETITLEMFDGTVLTYKAFISQLESAYGTQHRISVRVAVYDGSGTWLANLGADGVTATLPYNYIKIGICLTSSSWTLRSADNKVYPNVGLKKCISIDGAVTVLSSISLSGHGFSNPVPCTDAERDFGLALTTRTEPVS